MDVWQLTNLIWQTWQTTFISPQQLGCGHIKHDVYIDHITHYMFLVCACVPTHFPVSNVRPMMERGVDWSNLATPSHPRKAPLWQRHHVSNHLTIMATRPWSLLAVVWLTDTIWPLASVHHQRLWCLSLYLDDGGFGEWAAKLDKCKSVEAVAWFGLLYKRWKVWTGMVISRGGRQVGSLPRIVGWHCSTRIG